MSISKKSKVGNTDLIGGLKIAVNNVEDDEKEDNIKKQLKEIKKRKWKRDVLLILFQIRVRRRDKRETNQIASAGTERKFAHPSERSTPSSELFGLRPNCCLVLCILGKTKQSSFPNTYIIVQFSVSSREKPLRGRKLGKDHRPYSQQRVVESCCSKMYLEVAVRPILALEVVCKANMDWPWDTVRDTEENCHC